MDESRTSQPPGFSLPQQPLPGSCLPPSPLPALILPSSPLLSSSEPLSPPHGSFLPPSPRRQYLALLCLRLHYPALLCFYLALFFTPVATSSLTGSYFTHVATTWLFFPPSPLPAWLFFASVAATWLFFASAAAKPLVYVTLNANFRRGCREVMCMSAMRCYRRHAYTITTTSTLAKKNHVGIDHMQYDRLSQQQLSLFEEFALRRTS